MPRHKDYDWNLPEGTPSATGGKHHGWDSIHAALLMDLRDELRRLNARLSCPAFLMIPNKLDKIERNTKKKPRKKKPK